MKTNVRIVVAAVLIAALGQTAGTAGEDEAAARAAKKAARAEAAAEKANDRAEAREEHHAKRINQGVKKGFLTPDEVNKIDAQQKDIESFQQSLKSDGRLSRDEARQLKTQLNSASMDIFAEKHDADGKTKAVVRLGRDVTLKNDVAQKLGGDDLSKQDAKAYLSDFHRMMGLKRNLSAGTMNDADRAVAQDQYNDLLNKYFDEK